jgi:hypothetical protein
MTSISRPSLKADVEGMCYRYVGFVDVEYHERPEAIAKAPNKATFPVNEGRPDLST